MASRETRFIDHQPATQATSTAAKTMKRLRTEKSMMRLIMVHRRTQRGRGDRLQTSFGADQKIAGDGDAFAGGETFDDLDIVAELGARLNGARLENAFGRFDEDSLLKTGIEHGLGGNGEAGGGGDRQLD